MLTERLAFGACFMNNQIFAVGGKSIDKMKTKKCETFDVIKNKWIEIADLLEFSYNTNIIGYQNEYILRVGG